MFVGYHGFELLMLLAVLVAAVGIAFKRRRQRAIVEAMELDEWLEPL